MMIMITVVINICRLQ